MKISTNKREKRKKTMQFCEKLSIHDTSHGQKLDIYKKRANLGESKCSLVMLTKKSLPEKMEKKKKNKICT